jgi:hypothetical protein
MINADKLDLDNHPDARLIAAAPELLEACKVGANALRSYQYGNGSPDLAQEIAEKLEALIIKVIQ